MSKFERTSYVIDSYSWHEPGQGQSGFWTASGTENAGSTLEKAYQRVKDNYARVDEKNRDKVKYEIIKVTVIKEKIEEWSGPDITALFLKT